MSTCAPQQVSWCALEVGLDSPKCIASSGSAGPQEPPPLVVAALNLKTTLHPQVPPVCEPGAAHDLALEA